MISALTGMLALGLPLWWMAMYISSGFRERFVPYTEWTSFQSLLLPDLGLALITGAAAVVVRADRRPASLFACATGAWGYATVYTLSFWSRTGAPAAGLILVSVACTIMIVCCYAVVATPDGRRG